MPETIFEKIKNRIRPEWKVCFIWAVVIGLIAHLYKITNWLPNWDSLVLRYDSQNMVRMGRWFLPVVCAPSSFYDLPFITGVLAIIFHALGAVCIVKMLGVKKNITAALIGGLVASFPAVTSLMMYNYSVDGYALAFLLSCLAAMCITREKPRYLLAVVLIALSTGIYQAYITVTVMLILISLILEVLYKKTDLKGVLVKSLKCLIGGILGIALYYLVLTLILKVTGTALLDYQGFSSATSLEGLDILGSLYTIKETFVNYFFDFSQGISTFTVLNCIIFALTAVFYLTDIIKNKLSFSKILFLIVCVGALPLGASVLAFINSGVDYHNLMKMGFLVFYLFLILQYERCEGGKSGIAKAWVVLLLAAVLVFNQVIIANVSYHKLNMSYEKSYGELIRIADRIEETEGAGNCERILVLGHLPGSDAYSVNLPPDMTGTTDAYIIREDDELVGQSVLCTALNDYCGKNYSFVHGSEKEKLLEKFDADSLNAWPEENSTSVVEDVIVIKLGDQKTKEG